MREQNNQTTLVLLKTDTVLKANMGNIKNNKNLIKNKKTIKYLGF